MENDLNFQFSIFHCPLYYTILARKKKAPVWGQTGNCLLHKFFHSLAQAVDGAFVAQLDGVHHAVADVVVQDHLAGVVDGAADGGQLDQDRGAVIALLHHALDLVQVADGPGQTVDDRLLILVDVDVVVNVRHGAGLLSSAYYIIFFAAAQPAPGDNREK